MIVTDGGRKNHSVCVFYAHIIQENIFMLTSILFFPDLQKTVKESNMYRMISDAGESQFLRFLLKLVNAKKAIEIGS